MADLPECILPPGVLYQVSRRLEKLLTLCDLRKVRVRLRSNLVAQLLDLVWLDFSPLSHNLSSRIFGFGYLDRSENYQMDRS